jgi:hypothetical protein
MLSHRIRAGVVFGVSLALTLSSYASTRHKVEENCRGALAARGYPGFNLDRVNVQSSRSGWSMDGQMTKGSKRYEFTCVTDEHARIHDVNVHKLGSSGGGSSAAGAALAAAAILGIAALASHDKHHKGTPPDDPKRLAEHERGYRDGLHSAPFNDYRDSADYRAGFDAGVEQRGHVVSHNQRQRWDDGRHGAPAELMMACANEADRYWRLPSGSAVPKNSRATGSGMYEVKLAAGWQRGTCTVDENGSVKSIMND